MDLRAAILKEHSKKQCSLIVKYIGDDKKRFAELMKLFFSGEYRVTQRAGWPMSYCIQNHPSLINPYYKKLLVFLKRKDVHPAVERNIMRLLEDVDIPKRYQGEIMNSCFEYISDPQAAVAVKAFSLGVLKNLIKIYPEILPEIKLIIEERWDTETAAFRSRGKRFLKMK